MLSCQTGLLFGDDALLNMGLIVPTHHPHQQGALQPSPAPEGQFTIWHHIIKRQALLN